MNSRGEVVKRDSDSSGGVSASSASQRAETDDIKDDREEKRKAMLTRNAIVMVEPKTIFSNERTLLEWINLCVFVGASGMYLMRYTTGQFYTSGVCILWVFETNYIQVAIFILARALWLTRKRTQLLEEKAISLKYHLDYFGPRILTVVTVYMTIAVVLVRVGTNQA